MTPTAPVFERPSPEKPRAKPEPTFDEVRALFLADDVSVLNSFIVRDSESLTGEEQQRQAKLIVIQGSIATLLDWGKQPC